MWKSVVKINEYDEFCDKGCQTKCIYSLIVFLSFDYQSGRHSQFLISFPLIDIWVGGGGGRRLTSWWRLMFGGGETSKMESKIYPGWHTFLSSVYLGWIQKGQNWPKKGLALTWIVALISKLEHRRHIDIEFGSCCTIMVYNHLNPIFIINTSLEGTQIGCNSPY